MSHALLHPSRWVSHLRLCTVTKEEEKMRNVNVYLLINSIACNELTTACHVWYLKSLKACTLFISHWLISQETRNDVEVNAPRLSVLGLFGFHNMTYTPRRREYLLSPKAWDIQQSYHLSNNDQRAVKSHRPSSKLDGRSNHHSCAS